MSRRDNNDRVEHALRGIRTGRDWLRVSCPFCADAGHTDRKQSLGVAAATGVYVCFRCNTRGRLDEPPDPALAVQSQQVETRTVGAVDVPEEFIPLWTGSGARAASFASARAYLASRRVGEQAWERYQLHVCGEGFWEGRVIVPMLSADGDSWCGWIGRLWASPSPQAEGRFALKYLNSKGLPRSILWNQQEVMRSTEEVLLVVEGLFDALPHTPNIAAVLGKPTHEQVGALLAADRPVVVALDGDAWQEGHMLSARLQFEGKHAGSLKLPPGLDPNDIDTRTLFRAARKSLGKWEPVSL